MTPATALRQLAAHFNGLNIRPRDNARPYVAQFSKGACIRYPNQNVLLVTGPDREESLIVAVEPVTSDKEAKQSIAGMIDAGFLPDTALSANIIVLHEDPTHARCNEIELMAFPCSALNDYHIALIGNMIAKLVTRCSAPGLDASNIKLIPPSPPNQPAQTPQTFDPFSL